MDPCDYLTTGIAAYAGLCLFNTLFVYAFERHWDPESPRKLSIFEFASFSWVFHRVRGPNNPMNMDDFPLTEGTDQLNANAIVSWFQASRRSSLYETSLSIMTPVWLSETFLRPGQYLNLVNVYTMSCIASYFEHEEHGPAVAFKIGIFLVVSTLVGSYSGSLKETFQQAYSINIVTALKVILMRKMRKLSPRSMAEMPMEELQNVIKKLCKELDCLLSFSPIKFLIPDVAMIAMSLWQLTSLFSMASVTTGLFVVALLQMWTYKCNEQVLSAQKSVEKANKGRLASLNEITDAMVALKCYAWGEKYLPSLSAAASSIGAAHVKQGLWGALGAAIPISDALCAVLFCVTAFTAPDKDIMRLQVFVASSLYAHQVRVVL
jgi:hypothetical protein